MIIIGVDFHPEFQQIAGVDTDTGEFQEKRLTHREEGERFYRELATRGMKVRVGMEASGHTRWLERLLAELQFELWIGDAAEIRTKRVRKQKTDPTVGKANHPPERNGALVERMRKCCRKQLDTADIVRDACFQQLTSTRRIVSLFLHAFDFINWHFWQLRSAHLGFRIGLRLPLDGRYHGRSTSTYS